MTGREGETFPGFFYGRSRAAGYGRTRGPLVAGGRRWPRVPSLGVRRHLWLEEVAAREAPPAFWWRCIGGAGKAGGMHCEGPIPALPVAGLFWGGSMLLEKMQTFFCVFSVC